MLFCVMEMAIAEYTFTRFCTNYHFTAVVRKTINISESLTEEITLRLTAVDTTEDMKMVLTINVRKLTLIAFLHLQGIKLVRLDDWQLYSARTFP